MYTNLLTSNFLEVDASYCDKILKYYDAWHHLYPLVHIQIRSQIKSNPSVHIKTSIISIFNNFTIQS
jgi:hypothetical protein